MTSCNYAGGDPVNSSDPSGRSFSDVVKGAEKASGIKGYVDFAGTLASGDGSEIVAEGFGLLAEGVTTAGCSAAVGTSVVGVGYCFGVGQMVGGLAESGARNYGRSAQW